MLKYIKPEGTPNLDQLEEALAGWEIRLRDTVIRIAARLGSEPDWSSSSCRDMVIDVANEIDNLLLDIMPPVSMTDDYSVDHWRAVRDELQQRGQA